MINNNSQEVNKRYSVVDKELIGRIRLGQAEAAEIKAYYLKLEEFLGSEESYNHPDRKIAAHQFSSIEYLAESLFSAPEPDLSGDRQKVGNGNGKNSKPESKFEFTKEDLEREIDLLIDRNLPESQLTYQISSLSRLASVSDFSLWKIYKAKQRELEDKSYDPQLKLRINEILSLEDQDIIIEEFIPKFLSSGINGLCKRLSVRPIVALTALLSAASSCHRIGTRVWISYSQNFKEFPYLWAAIVAGTGQKKSPLLDSFALEPLQKIQFKEKQEYLKAVAEYNEQINHYKSLTKDEQKIEYPEGQPSEPGREKIRYLTNANVQAFNRQFEAYPQKAIAYICDELAGWFKNLNNSRGVSDERTAYLSYFNCKGVTELRVGGVASNIRYTGMSILGTIQPDILAEFFGNGEDSDGLMSRFLYVNQPRSIAVLEPEGANYILDEVLVDLFERIHSYSPRDYRLDPQAFALYRAYYDSLEKKAYYEEHKGIAAIYSKAEGYTARLALNLHIIDEILDSDRDEPFELVSELAMSRAIKLMNFYISQARLLYSKLNDDNELDSKMLKIIQFSKRKGKVTARDVKMGIKSLRKVDSSEIRRLFLDLVRLDYGKVGNSGNKLYFEVYDNA